MTIHRQPLAILVLTCFYLFGANNLTATPSITLDGSALDFGFARLPVISPKSFQQHLIAKNEVEGKIKTFCQDLNPHFSRFKWEQNPCGRTEWKARVLTQGGHPLLYAEFGKGEEVTLLISGVHPDEITPIPLGFRFAEHLSQHPELYTDLNIKIIVAPLANPDGFLTTTPKRTNTNGVDLNRNFLTGDWYAKAKQVWRSGKDLARRFPGHFPNSEIETLFQVQLIDEFAPDKILSIHSPLGFLDYDGPGDRLARPETGLEHEAKKLLLSISQKTRNYRVVDFSSFPGSLGNFAGIERSIPTITLELETTDASKVNAYWEQFLPGLVQFIRYPLRKTTRGPNHRAAPLSQGYFLTAGEQNFGKFNN